LIEERFVRHIYLSLGLRTSFAILLSVALQSQSVAATVTLQAEATALGETNDGTPAPNYVRAYRGLGDNAEPRSAFSDMAGAPTTSSFAGRSITYVEGRSVSFYSREFTLTNTSADTRLYSITNLIQEGELAIDGTGASGNGYAGVRFGIGFNGSPVRKIGADLTFHDQGVYSSGASSDFGATTNSEGNILSWSSFSMISELGELGAGETGTIRVSASVYSNLEVPCPDSCFGKASARFGDPPNLNYSQLDAISYTTISAVPEPQEWILMSAGLVITTLIAKRRRKAAI
jgi:hypothetical protein